MNDKPATPPAGGQRPRYGTVSAPIGALRRARLGPVEIVPEEAPPEQAPPQTQEGPEGPPPPAISFDHLVRAQRRAPSANRMQVVFAVVMLLMGAVTGLLFEPQWRSGKSVLPPAVIAMVKAVPGLGPWFVAKLKTKPDETELAGNIPVGLTPPQIDEFLPDQLVEMSPDLARRTNASMPVARIKVMPASGFQLPQTDYEARRRAAQCLTAAVYYEAGNESSQGQAAVAQVILNRMRHPAYPKSVCGVVFEGSQRTTGCQFTFTCDGSLRRVPDPVRWRRAQGVAEAALNGAVETSVGLATHYHADYVLPKWASKLTKTQVIGAHIFYRWNGGWGSPGAFNGKYAGAEQVITGLWPIETPEIQLVDIPPPPVPMTPVTLAALERPAVAASEPAAPPPVVAPAPQVQTTAPAPVTPPPQVSAPAPKNKQREPGARPRLPVPNNW